MASGLRFDFTGVSRAEARQIFSAFDSDGDGMVSENEVKEGLKEYPGIAGQLGLTGSREQAEVARHLFATKLGMKEPSERYPIRIEDFVSYFVDPSIDASRLTLSDTQITGAPTLTQPRSSTNAPPVRAAPPPPSPPARSPRSRRDGGFLGGLFGNTDPDPSPVQSYPASPDRSKPFLSQPRPSPAYSVPASNPGPQIQYESSPMQSRAAYPVSASGSGPQILYEASPSPRQYRESGGRGSYSQSHPSPFYSSKQPALSSPRQTQHAAYSPRQLETTGTPTRAPLPGPSPARTHVTGGEGAWAYGPGPRLVKGDMEACEEVGGSELGVLDSAGACWKGRHVRILPNQLVFGADATSEPLQSVTLLPESSVETLKKEHFGKRFCWILTVHPEAGPVFMFSSRSAAVSAWWAQAIFKAVDALPGRNQHLHPLHFAVSSFDHHAPPEQRTIYSV